MPPERKQRVFPWVFLAAAIIAGLALAGCGASSSHSTIPVSAGQPGNPVPIVRETGATVTPGEVYGSTTAEGWLSADGSFASGERVDVYTLPAGLTGQQAIAQVGVTSSDSQTVIAGSSFYIFVYPAEDMSTGVSTYPVSPATIAGRVHGTVLTPQS